MMKTAFLAAALLCVMLSQADARHGHRASVSSCVETGTVMAPVCLGQSAGFLTGVRSIKVRMTRERPRSARQASRKAASATGWTHDAPQTERAPAGIVAPLAAKAAEISAACGSRIISGLRHTNIRGTRRLSLHASGKAIDMAGNPSCIYRQLAGWQGGYSVDYGRVRHVHISYDAEGGREWGVRFAHGGQRHRHVHRHRGHRYAVAS